MIVRDMAADSVRLRRTVVVRVLDGSGTQVAPSARLSVRRTCGPSVRCTHILACARRAVLQICLAAVLLAATARASEPSQGAGDAGAELDALYDAYVARFRPLYLEQCQAWWDANITGTDEAFQRRREADAKLLDLHSDRQTFARLKALKDGGKVTDATRKRKLVVMYLSFLPAQGDPELSRKIIDLEAKVEQTCNHHRGVVDGRPHTENDIRKILAESTDSAAAEQAWKAYMEVGAKVEAQLAELVRLRNESARQLGFNSFYSMKLATQEIDPAELFQLFDELDELTREPFAELKRELDAERAARFGIDTAALRPWHYGDLFFQEAPTRGQAVNLDALYEGKDIVALATAYYASMGMPIEDVLARSDLYEKPGKSPHAYCSDMDRAGDIRIFCNLKPNLMWMGTLLHELGHAVYDKYLSPDLPFVLRTASSGVTTEGIAMLLGAMANNEEFLVKVVGIEPGPAKRAVPAARRALRREKLIFSRWAQVMVRFEHGMYANPDQDLGKLWWDLKKRYQLLNSPETTSRPDYAAKHHVVAAPVYYHSYMMGSLFSCQVYDYVAKNVMGVADPHETSFFQRKDVADYLRERVFAPGKLYSWDELTRRATGEPLTAKYFAQLYVSPQDRQAGSGGAARQ
ncbi:MAG: M2 family metallopeptidase [Phycisphaerales bacterium]|nr:MAG: M2 family metallopeptidase [Phycisphaerales bacterium]